MLSAMRQKFGGHVEAGVPKPAAVKKAASARKPAAPPRDKRTARRKTSRVG
jgi:hypothetical protein